MTTVSPAGHSDGSPPGFRKLERDAPRWAIGPRVAAPAIVLAVIALGCFLPPAVFPVPKPIGGQTMDANLPLLSAGHVLGTDSNGNDTLSRLLHGGRASLLIAVAVNFTGLFLGGFLGALAGYSGRTVDGLVMRVLDVLIAFPSLVLAAAIAQVLGSGYRNTIVALALFSIPAFARVARSSALVIRQQAFIEAAVVSGSGTLRILSRHVFPGILPQLSAFAMLGMGIVVILEGGLSFLGLGIQAPSPSWGNMIFAAQQSLATRPIQVMLPSALLVLTALSCNLVGEALRERRSG